eukprot:392317-Karenia_brevis.AAC.1
MDFVVAQVGAKRGAPAEGPGSPGPGPIIGLLIITLSRTIRLRCRKNMWRRSKWICLHLQW